MHSLCHESSCYLCTMCTMSEPLIGPQFWKQAAPSTMKILAVIFALVALSGGFKIDKIGTRMLTQEDPPWCDDETTTPCFDNCCENYNGGEDNWVCCDANLPCSFVGCRPTQADCDIVCPPEAKRVQMVKPAKSNQCDPETETLCPNGCCPIPHA